MSQPIAMPQSDFARALTDDALQQIYRSELLTKLHEENSGNAVSDEHHDFSPEDLSREAKEAGYLGTPVAHGLTDEEQQDLYAQGDDPWARDTNGTAHKRLDQPPFDAMFSAARALFAINDQSMLDKMRQPGAITSFILSDEETRYGFERGLADLITALAVTQKVPAWETVQRITIGPPVQVKPGLYRQRALDTSELEKLVRAGETVFAVMAKAEDLPQFARPLSSQTFHLPPFNRAIAIAILRQTHSVTGELAEDEILRRLPTDADLADLPLATIASAFHAETTLKTADRLAEFCALLERPAPATKPALTLDSMALSSEMEAQAAQLLTDLTLWQDGKLEWTDVPSSVFLYGEPGNGKTLFAQSLAGSADIPLIATSYADCQKAGHLGDYLNEMAGQVEMAIKQAPCVFLIDEMDNFFTRSAADHTARYMHSVVNGLLEQLSKLNDAPGVILIGAGNNRAGIDPAVLRSGRFDRHIELTRPDHRGIQTLLRHLSGEVITAELAREMADGMLGCSAADVANLLRRARATARCSGEAFQLGHLRQELKSITSRRTSESLYRSAIHEAGHTIVAHHLGKPLPERVQITVQGGEYHSWPETCLTAALYEDQLAILMGGRAAEVLLLGAPSNGGTTDLQDATALAFQARHQWGLYDNTLIALPADLVQTLTPSHGIGKQINEDMQAALLTAREIIEERQDQLTQIAEALLTHRELTRDMLEEVMDTPDGGPVKELHQLVQSELLRLTPERH